MATLKEIDNPRVARGLIYHIILQFLETESLSEHQIMRRIPRTFGLHFKLNDIRWLLTSLEEKGYVKGMASSCPRQRKAYDLTVEGRKVLGYLGGHSDVGCAYALLPVLSEF